MIRQVLKIFKALNSDEKPWQLSLGLAFGGIIGLMPLFLESLISSILFSTKLALLF